MPSPSLANYIKTACLILCKRKKKRTVIPNIFKYNSSLASEYMDYFQKMQERFGIENDVKVSVLARMPAETMTSLAGSTRPSVSDT